jgi:hypothetical protein
MLPPLKTVKAGLHRATEALAQELAQPGTVTPDWNGLQWRLASAAVAAHTIAPLLNGRCRWQHPQWQRFLREQREHVEHRQWRIVTLLERIDDHARAVGLAVVPLKGSALHALGLYAPGERPMADIDLLVREGDTGTAVAMLQALGYVESYAQWKHRVFKPARGEPVPGLGEHRDTPINIELHVRIQERLPVSTVDITERIHPRQAQPGLNDYPSIGALMRHLLLHAAGNICSRSMRLMHLHDIALLSARMTADDWTGLVECHEGGASWWALPPLNLVNRYYPRVIPTEVLARLARHCPLLLRKLSRRQTITQVSCSELWLHPLAGMEWSRSAHDVSRYLRNRIRPSQEAIQERADMVRTQLWLQGQDWVRLSHYRRVINWLARPVPRMDIMYAVRAAMEAPILVR